MEPSFWHQKWADKQIGFHQNQVNPLLETYWPRLELAKNTRVFVPLCGKSLDMFYLAEQGHDVVGCELNEEAVTQFFSESDLGYTSEKVGLLQRFDTEQVSIFQGDLFALTQVQLGNKPNGYGHAFYDRAALIAWPEEMRLAYVEKLAELIPPKSIGLLITLDYPQEVIKGPPFAVSNSWIVNHMSEYFDVEMFSCEDVLNDNPRFVNKAVPWLTESVYRLVRK